VAATGTDRAAIRQRIDDLNAAAASTCASFPSCSSDGGAAHAIAFVRSDLAFDYFHLSPAGQARISAAAWAAGPFAHPDPLADFAASPGVGAVALSWRLPAGVSRVLVQKAGAPPSSPSDGTTVYDGTGTSGGVSLTALTAGLTYYYAAWTYDVDGASGGPARAQAVPSSSGFTVASSFAAGRVCPICGVTAGS
jgi:hypothetical protein